MSAYPCAGNFHNYELIFVDDGSTDESYRILAELHKTDGRVKVIRFRKNFGQTAALSAGFAHSQGAIVLPSTRPAKRPADIPKMWKNCMRDMTWSADGGKKGTTTP